MLELLDASAAFGAQTVLHPHQLRIEPGTTTVLVGAGGCGQPILTGIRLDDVGLILQGALPAALLALLVQGLFDGLERIVVPKGLST